MTTRKFTIVLLMIAAAGGLILFLQDRAISHTRNVAFVADAPENPVTHESNNTSIPSPALLQLRNEVAMLTKQIQENSPLSRSPQSLAGRWTSEWEEIHSGPMSSNQPGFVSFKNLSNPGHATPAQAFESFQFALRNQSKEPLSETKMKEIWDLPDDYDDPKAKYSINIGRGISSETGYRVVREETISTNEIKLILDYSTADGASLRDERIVVFRNGKWRLKPAGLSRAN